MIGANIIEEVNELTYLGLRLKVTKDGNSKFEVRAKISKARGAFPQYLGDQ